MRAERRGSRRVREDYELDRLLLRYRFGLGKGNDLTVEAPLMSRSGGLLDGVIDIWHRYVLQIHDNIRDGQPYGRTLIELPGHARYGSAGGLGDISIALSHQVDPRLLASTAVKLPTGSPSKLFGSGAADFGAALQWRTPLQPRMDLHVQVGCIFQGKSRDFPEARTSILQGAVSLAYRANGRDIYIGQWQAEPSAMVTRVQGSDTSHRVVSLGVRHKVNKSQSVEFFLMEDGDWLSYQIPEFANLAPDLTLGIRWIWRN